MSRKSSVKHARAELVKVLIECGLTLVAAEMLMPKLRHQLSQNGLCIRRIPEPRMRFPRTMPKSWM